MKPAQLVNQSSSWFGAEGPACDIVISSRVRLARNLAGFEFLPCLTPERKQDILDKLHFDTSGFGGWMPITNVAISIIGPGRLCFGTDYGFEMHEAADIKLFIDNIKKLDLPEQDKRNILGENVRRLFRLKK